MRTSLKTQNEPEQCVSFVVRQPIDNYEELDKRFGVLNANVLDRSQDNVKSCDENSRLRCSGGAVVMFEFGVELSSWFTFNVSMDLSFDSPWRRGTGQLLFRNVISLWFLFLSIIVGRWMFLGWDPQIFFGTVN